ncbi:GspE/PulE family protein [Chrysiogenes arsenatis]|uniref:GspE/PulE family protein n=1 Tax=Chrysiogenes arsenatis TaxID=309797 RepID=UPI000417CB97|nr:GspE/PulE family protein [Chrysiogenes arsenatis]
MSPFDAQFRLPGMFLPWEVGEDSRLKVFALDSMDHSALQQHVNYLSYRCAAEVVVFPVSAAELAEREAQLLRQDGSEIGEGEASLGGVGGASDDFRVEDLLAASANDAPVIQFVGKLLQRALDQQASDIHIEPYREKSIIRLRLDGALHPMFTLPRGAHAAVVTRIKVIAGLDIAQTRLPQDGRLKIRIAGQNADIRVSTAPTVFGERVVMRLLDASSEVRSLDTIGLDEQQQALARTLLAVPHGILFVTGPTGSGKTTTLYSFLLQLHDAERNIMTIEDPVEYQIEGIAQTQVNPQIGLTFASGLRSFLRQDPDVIMVGETRDAETATIATQAALTGHLVLSTLHTNDACSAVTRLADMGVEPFLISGTLVGAVAQRLVRRLCPQCRQSRPLSPKEVDLFETHRVACQEVFFAPGCPHCLQTGYRGRSAIYEFYVPDETQKKLIAQGADHLSLRQAARDAGMRSLLENGLDRVAAGVTSLEEVLRVSSS